jgi:alpha-N-arabinofuranosidase
VVELEGIAPNLTEHRFPSPPACDHFEGERLALCWNVLRTPREPFWSLTECPGFLRLRLRPQTLAEYANSSFVGRRQQHQNFTARLAMEFAPASPGECAGAVLIQNHDHHFRLVAALNAAGERVARLEQRAAGVEAVLGEIPAGAGRLYLKIEAVGQAYSFYAATAYEQWHPVALDVDGRILSTTVAQGFTGVYVGMYASSSGVPSDNVADFDWFEYVGE